ncbi:hypothetical protein BFW01_g8904 [Lasiodiplodia theobromae]|nr:hypothetical protein BFW01_g8904 [Lasiodiplodia theobromae]
MTDNKNSGSNQSSGTSNPMTNQDSSRVQSTQAKGGGDISSGGFAARAKSAGDRNTVNSAKK